MSRTIASELLKLRTTRTFLALVASALLLVGVITTLAAALAKNDGRGLQPGEDLVGLAFFGLLFALVLGLLSVTTELRHGTITPTLLAVPSRGRLVAAKVVVHLVAGFVLGLVAVLLDIALVETILASRGIETGTSLAEAARWTIGASASAALLAALGVGVGALVRNQVGALVGTLAWVFVAEPLLAIVPGLEDAAGKVGIGGLVDGLDGYAGDSGTEVLGQLPAGLLLAAYVVLAALAAAMLLQRRDVTT